MLFYEQKHQKKSKKLTKNTLTQEGSPARACRAEVRGVRRQRETAGTEDSAFRRPAGGHMT